MANVPVHFSATLEDGFSTRKATNVYLNPPDTTTLAQLAAAIGTWLADLDAGTDAAIIANQIRVVPALPGGLKAASGATWQRSFNPKSGVIRFSVSGTSRAWSAVIPALSQSVIASGKPDVHGATLGTFITLLTTPSNGYVSPNNEALLALEQGIIGDRSNRKQLQANSRAV